MIISNSLSTMVVHDSYQETNGLSNMLQFIPSQACILDTIGFQLETQRMEQTEFEVFKDAHVFGGLVTPLF